MRKLVFACCLFAFSEEEAEEFGLEFDSANFNWKFPRKFGQFTETDRTAGSRQRDDDSALSDDVAGGRSDTERQSRRAVKSSLGT